MSIDDHLEFRHLTYIIAVAETGSFTAAAQTVHVAQSAISRQIGEIEGIFHIQIFQRVERKGSGKRRVHRIAKLTIAGESLLGFAHQLLEMRKEIIEVIQGIEQSAMRPFRLGFTPFVDPHVLETVTHSYRDPRTIPLNSIALAALRELQAGQSEPGTELVFPSVRTGDGLQGSRGWFSTALDDAKVLDYTWHCNRHTFASRLVMAGVDLRTVAELLGHRTLQMVMRYSHLAPEHQASAVDRLVPAEGRVATKSATDKSAVKNPKQTQTLTH